MQENNSDNEGKAVMKYKNKVADITDELKIFVKDLIRDYGERLAQCIQKKKEYMDKAYEKEAYIHTLTQQENQGTAFFSPNSGKLLTEEHYKELENIKQIIKDREEEEKKLETQISKLMEIERILVNQENSSQSIGINILELQEQDRQRIARDLHDSTVQNLTSLIHKCELCLRLIDMDTVRAKLELNAMSNTLKAVINEIREIIYNLKPMSLDDLGLITTVERYINQLMMNHDIKIKLTHNREINVIPPVVKLSLFRVIQEACSNAIKHSDAKNINIDLRFYENEIKASVSDDGKGFDLNSVKENLASDYSGYGLSIMKERVNLLSGTMNIQSTTKKGTIVTISVPIVKSEGDQK